MPVKRPIAIDKQSRRLKYPPVVSESLGSSSLRTIIVPRLLRIQDAAKYLSATTWFVETMIREKKIPSLILGKRYVLDIDDLNAWIEKEKEIQRTSFVQKEVA